MFWYSSESLVSTSKCLANFMLLWWSSEYTRCKIQALITHHYRYSRTHGITLSHGATDMACQKAPQSNCYRHGMTYGITLSHYCGDMLHILMQHTSLHKSISLYFNWVRTSSMTASNCWQGWVKMNSNCKTSQRSSADCCICSSEKLRTW